MTKAEYSRLLTRARKRIATLSRSAMEELKVVYEDASKNIADTIRNAPADGLEQRGAEIVEKQLRQGVAAINDELGRLAVDRMESAADLHAAINERQILDIVSKSIARDVITEPGVRNMLRAVNTSLISTLINQQLQDGYRLSDRVWASANDYQTQITRVIDSGVAQGRSTIDIAKDIEDYTQGGRAALGPGYQGAKFGTLVVKNVDWRALRLVRSEIASAMQQAALADGEANPASAHLYNWILTPGREHWNCECESLARGSPYKTEDVPTYPHPNCFCRLEPELVNEDEMLNRWANWINGGEEPELDNWHKNYYRQVAA